MSLIIVLGLVVLLTIVPVMISAKLLNAKNAGFFSCLFAVIASVAADHISNAIIVNELLAAIASIAITAMFFSFILGAKYIQSIVIAVLAYAVQIAIVIGLTVVGYVGANSSLVI